MCAGASPGSIEGQSELTGLEMSKHAVPFDSRFFLPEIHHVCYKTPDEPRPCTFEELLSKPTEYENVTVHVATHPHLTRYSIITVQRRLDSPLEQMWDRCRNAISFHATYAEGRIHHYYNCEHQCAAAVDSHDLCINK